MTSDLNKKGTAAHAELLRFLPVSDVWRLCSLTAFCLLHAACGAPPSLSEPAEPPESTRREPPPTPVAEDRAGTTRAPIRVDLGLESPNGLSGLTRTSDGTLWAVAESDRFLIAIVDDRVARVVPLAGVPEGLDAEAITWLGGDRFLIGTESMDATRTEEQLLLVVVGEDDARVVEQLVVPYEAIDGSADENEGVEAICHVEGTTVIATEHTVRDETGRYAAIGLRDDATGAWRASRLKLTTDTGKISAMDCRMRGGVLEVFAIERHYAVMRVLTFEIGPRSPPTIAPTIAEDLAGALENDPNLEGLALGVDEVITIVDNHYGRRSGPNELVHLPGIGRFAQMPPGTL